MSEHLSPNDEYANWTAPDPSPQSERPGGELHTRPIQGSDGQWQDGYGNRISETEARDIDYATRFWRQQPAGQKQAMQEIIQNQVELGKFSLFVSPSGISEGDEEKLSAYRLLAREMGYEIGSFHFNPNAHTVTAEIKTF